MVEKRFTTDMRLLRMEGGLLDSLVSLPLILAGIVNRCQVQRNLSSVSCILLLRLPKKSLTCRPLAETSCIVVEDALCIVFSLS